MTTFAMHSTSNDPNSSENAEVAELGCSAPPNDSTFAPTFRLLRRQLRDDVLRLYAALRTLDDLVDDRRPEAAGRIDAVERWCRHGVVDCPEAGVFADLAGRRGLRTATVAEFCLGMRHDIERSAIESEDELELYCRHVSGAVGVMIAQLTGAPAKAEEMMAALGKGVQLAHIIRDIDVDLADGRIYIPREMIERFGSIAPGEREDLLKELISRADDFFDEAASVVSILPEGKRWVSAGAALYRETLRQIEREGYGRNPGRAVVPVWRQRTIIAKSLFARR